MTQKTICFIFARGGSKGIKGKNIRLFAGKPLIAYAIETALASRLIDRVFVSTDNADIARVAREYGAEIPFLRPSELSQDTSSELDAWRHAIHWLKSEKSFQNFDTFVSVPAVAPLRDVNDVDACITAFHNSDADVVITVKHTSRSPYFNMIKLDEEGYARLVIPPSPGQTFVRRQDVPEIFDMTTVCYVARPGFILKTHSLFDGRVRTVIVPEERAIDIDTELDFAIAEYLMKRRQNEYSDTA